MSCINLTSVKRRISMAGLFLFLALTTSSCSTPPSPTVSIEVSDLLAQTNQLGNPISKLMTVALREGTPVASLMMDVATADQVQIDLEVPAGNVLFELTGFSSDESSQLTPIYFGDTLSTITPYQRNELKIVMFQAGRLDVEIEVKGTAESLPNTLVRFIPLNRVPGQSESYQAPFSMTNLSRVLPTGRYEVKAEASFDGREFSDISKPVIVEIEAGETNAINLVIDL